MGLKKNSGLLWAIFSRLSLFCSQRDVVVAPSSRETLRMSERSPFAFVRQHTTRWDLIAIVIARRRDRDPG